MVPRSLRSFVGLVSMSNINRIKRQIINMDFCVFVCVYRHKHTITHTYSYILDVKFSQLQAQWTYLLEKLLCLGASTYRENSKGLWTWDPMNRDSVSLQTFSFFCIKHLLRKSIWFLIHSHTTSRLHLTQKC